ncbi:hypothetical protein ACP70R_013039 [Stipagrostis hirtigluma subsp. patula]
MHRCDDAFSCSYAGREEDDGEEAWATLAKLPSCDRVHRAVLPVGEGATACKQLVDVRYLGPADRRALLERLVAGDDTGNGLLLRMKNRLDRVGMDVPMVEVRFERLSAQAEVRVGGSGLPTVLNMMTNKLQEAANALNLLSSGKQTLPILHNVSGIIKPSR